MTDQTDDSKRKRTRSPEHPSINLETALKRAKQFYDIETRNSASLIVASKHWGYEPKSSGGLQTAATLISFGLLKDEGTGEKRKLQLSPIAIRILLDARPDSPERADLIKRVALTPRIHKQLWEDWGASLPSDAQFRHTLIVDWEPPFNEKSVDHFIKEYKDTIAFAKLTESDQFPPANGEPDGLYVPKVGDFVQWEASGVLRLPQAARIREISHDGKFALIDGSNTGIPISELIKERAPSIDSQTIPTVPDVRFQPTVSGRQMQKEVFSLKEGEVVLHWPSPLSEESVQDLKDWLAILERKFLRSVPPKDDNSSS